MIVPIEKRLSSASALLRRKSLGKRNGTGNSTQPAITCSKSTAETNKLVQSEQSRQHGETSGVTLLFLVLTC